jgi:hypothetical protein
VVSKSKHSLDALDGLAMPWYALRDGAVVDLVHIVVTRTMVLPRHGVHGLLRGRGRCAQKGRSPASPGPGIVICIVVLERVGWELVVQRRWRGGMHIAEGVGLAWGRRSGEAA